MGKGRGGGKTPVRITELLKKAVAESSQVAVSNATGLTRLTVQRYLKGIGEPSQETCQKLADFFGVTPGWLRGEEPEISTFHGSVDEAIDFVRKILLSRGLDTEEVESAIQEYQELMAKKKPGA